MSRTERNDPLRAVGLGREKSAWTENRWKAALAKALRERGCRVLSLHGHGMQQPGWPDLYFARGGFSYWLELKAPGGELSAAQSLCIRTLGPELAAKLVATPDWSGAELHAVPPVGRSGATLVMGVPLLDAEALVTACRNMARSWAH